MSATSARRTCTSSNGGSATFRVPKYVMLRAPVTIRSWSVGSVVYRRYHGRRRVLAHHGVRLAGRDRRVGVPVGQHRDLDPIRIGRADRIGRRGPRRVPHQRVCPEVVEVQVVGILLQCHAGGAAVAPAAPRVELGGAVEPVSGRSPPGRGRSRCRPSTDDRWPPRGADGSEGEGGIGAVNGSAEIPRGSGPDALRGS